MAYPEYEHWNEEADKVRYEENRDAYESGDPMADMTDAEIKQAVYDSMDEDIEDNAWD
jgi:hypothetical protein